MTCPGRRTAAFSNSNLHPFKQGIALLKDCAASADLERGTVLHAHLAKRGLLHANIYIANALLSLYTRCGAIANAQDVFDRLPVRDVVSWNTLIAAHAQQGNGCDAFECLERMKLEGTFPDVVTLVCCLKACGSERALNKGNEIHAAIVEQELLDGHIMVGTTLVDMYAKCGDLERAQGVFDHLPARDVVCWNALICGYNRQGHGDKALECFHQMQSDAVSPNVATFVGILKACGNMGAIDMGERVHHEILGRRILKKKNGELGNALLDMYAKCGEVAKAKDMFEELEERNVVSWNTIITAYVHQGDAEEALHAFERMQWEGCTPDRVTHICMLKACGCVGWSEKGEVVHAAIVKKGLWEEGEVVSMGTALVDMYAKCGLLATATHVFLHLPLQDLVAWGALISGYAQHGRSNETLIYFEQMQIHGFSPDAPILACILKACASKGEISMGREIHAETISRGFIEKPDAVLVSALVGMYAKLGALVDAQDIFDRTLFRNAVMWNALIAGHVDHGHSEKADDLIRRMYSEGFCPDEATIVCSLKACAHVEAFEKGKRMHAGILNDSSLSDRVSVGTALVDMYAKCGKLERAQELFEQLQERDAVSWNALITGYVRHGQGAVDDDVVWSHVQCMQREGHAPNAVTLICMLQACGSSGAADKGKGIHAMIANGRRSTEEEDDDVVLVDNAVVDMYAKCGCMTEARQVAERLPIQDVVSWTALIAGHARTGKDEMAIHLFNAMLGSGVEPDDITFALVLSACSHSGRLDRGVHSMCSQLLLIGSSSSCYGHLPTPQQYTCIVDLLARAGQLDMAAAVIHMMPPSSDYLPVWTALLGACQKWGNIQLARVAFHHALRLDEKHTAVYVCMSNIYALAGSLI